MGQKVIFVTSYKGGVGKTTVSVNLALALSMLKKKVLIIDANLTTPHVAIHYGFNEFSSALQDVLNNLTKIEDAIYKNERYNLDFIPSRVFKRLGDSNADYRILNLPYHISKLVNYYDFIVVDTRPSQDLDFVKLIPYATMVVVTTPDIVSLIEAKKLRDDLKNLGINDMYLVVNLYDRRSRDKMNIQDIKSRSGFSRVFEIPESKKMQEALKLGVPIVVGNSRDSAAIAFINFAKEIIR
ncbi:MAG: MinD/ParA family protein [Candidatus Parvarchaeota archaeon]|nr:MinD/ParA family protein [Candidatus Parvarchaeota archaeon]